ncbi:MAG: transporter substrate-binding domain-containing protein [Phycisphaerales bacterium]|nr:transporter substrate-binding domain-containing protein [Phycisphaerales bacterium]
MNRYICLLAVLLFFPLVSEGYEPASQSSDKKILRVGVAEEPPFTILNNGEWSGISVELWEMVAKSLGWKWQYESYSLSELLAKVEAREVDVAVGDITRTSAREETMDFSASYLDTGLSIVTKKEPVRSVLDVLSHLGDSAFLQLTVSLVIICILFGIFMWWAERRHNKEHFGGQMTHGFGSGVWWSMVTMSTVGYGDKAPRTMAGRAIGLIWIFLSIVLLSAFTGTIASSMTMGRLGIRISTVQDLRGLSIGSLESSEAGVWLSHNNIPSEGYDSVHLGLEAVVDGAITVFVGDRSAIIWQIEKYESGYPLLIQGNFHPERLCYAVPSSSTHIEELNVALLKFMESRSWRYLLAQYGEETLLMDSPGNGLLK